MFKSQYRNIVIAGGTGFVGQALATRLAREQYQVTLLSRDREQHRELLVLPTLRIVEVDFEDSRSLEKALAGADVLINLIGILNESRHDGKGFRYAHVTLTERLATAAATAGVKRFLQMSALNAGADGPSHYLRSKGEAENLLLTRFKALNVTVFKPSVIFGLHDSFLNRFAKLLKWLPVLPLACPDAKFAPVHVGDVAEFMLRAMNDPAAINQRFELCGPKVHTLRDIVATIRATGHARCFILPLPRALAYLQAMVCEFLPGKPFSVDNFNSLQKDSISNNSAFARYNMRPASLAAQIGIQFARQSTRLRLDEYRRRAGRLRFRD